MKSFLQTKEWLGFQRYLGRETWGIDGGKFRTNIIKHKMRLRKNYLYAPHGPEMDLNSVKSGLENEIGNFVRELVELGKKEKSMFIKIEPMSDVAIELMYRYGFKKSKKEIQPKKTVVLDLNKSFDELLSGMHHKTRYNIKVAERHEIDVKPSHDIDEFLKLLKKTTKRDRFASHPEEYYKKLLDFFKSDGIIKTDLLMACHEGRPVAGAIILIYDGVGYYLHGASDHKYRSMMAPYALHWSIIKYLKEHGVEYYDFWGIDSKKWPGVTRFKLGWGGKQIEYPGSFDLPISKFWYIVYGAFRKIR